MQKERLISLDVLRGITILLMVIVNNPGSWSHVYAPLLHSEWNGCTPTDLVFPFFIFILGMAIPLALSVTRCNKVSCIKIVTRSLRIICLGLFLNFFNSIQIYNQSGVSLVIIRLVMTVIVGYALMGNYSEKWKLYIAIVLFSIFMILAFGFDSFSEIRLPGVLQRIGIVYFFASLAYLTTSFRTQILITVGFLLGYWAAMTLLPVPGFGDANLEVGTNFSGWIDQITLGNHVYKPTKTWDPEGLFSTIPAIAHALLGVLLGQLILESVSQAEKLKKTLLIGTALLLIGLAWSIIFPINKSIWTSSFVVYTSGIASLLFGILYYFIDIIKYRKFSTPLLIWGVNPMIVFFISGIAPRVLWMIEFQNPRIISEQVNLQEYLYQFGIAPFFSDPMLASLAGALTYAGIVFVLLFIFYKNKLIFKV